MTPDEPVSRIRLTGISARRQSVLIVRDGEHLLPWMAAAITAVREFGAEASR